ncbi:MAG: glycoside hydrolase family 5 protein [Lachnospiraceae bacterium]|nr:glycoside hydrolase family 5 protein [Lachnospiraceae bacterium]
MKSIKQFLCFCLIATILFSCQEFHSVAPISEAASISRLHVDGKYLKNAKNKTVQLKGISTHGISWYPEYINDKCFKQLHKWGANVVRLAMYSSEYNGYCTGDEANKKALKKRIETGVKLAKKYKMYVIIDWHIMNTDGNPLIHEKEAREFFTWASKKFKNTPNVIYEICNEPCNGTTWNDITSYANNIIPIIRKKASKSVIIVGTPNWSQELDKAVAAPLTYKNIMYALHFYAATHGDDLRKVLTLALNNGLPVFVSEFSICDASGNGSIDIDSAAQWMSLIRKNKISYCIWNLSNKNEASAIIKSSVSKTSGFTVSDLTKTGKWWKSQLKKKG